MTLNFAELKRSRNKDLEKLTQEAFKLNNKDEGKRSYEDKKMKREKLAHTTACITLSLRTAHFFARHASSETSLLLLLI